jgi:hypothetical protein
MPVAFGNLAARDPQKSDSNGNGNGNGKNSGFNSDTSRNDNTGADNNPSPTLLSVVFVTASPTFTGDVAGYTTLAQSAAPSTLEQSATDVLTEPQDVATSSIQYEWTPPASSAEPPAETTTQAPPSSTPEPATTYLPPTTSSSAAAVAVVDSSSLASASASALPTSIAVTVSSSTLLSYISVSSTATATRSRSSTTASATAIAEAATSKGMSSSGKVGLAIGIILIIALFAAGALWFYRKKKKDNEESRNVDNEKVGGLGAAVAMKTQSRKSVGIRAQKPDSSAPRLSLRPVTQFIPDLAAAKKRISQGNLLNMMNKPAGMAAAGAGRPLTRDNPTASPWERRAGSNSNASNPFNDPPVNPFGDQAKAAAQPPNVTITPPPSDDGSATGAGTGVGAVAGAAGAAGAAMVAGAGRKSNEQPQRAKGSPEGARMAAGGPPPGNVHRVQLDFQPSMDDELELRAGQLIRILHEYDDGWVWSCHP